MLKKLNKAIEDYEKAKEKAELLTKRAEDAVKKMKQCEAQKIEAENMEYAAIVREMQLSIPELRALQNQLKTGLPHQTVLEEMKEEEHEENEQSKG